MPHFIIECSQLAALLQDIAFLSVNIDEFEKATYCNKALINPENTDQNRHFGL